MARRSKQDDSDAWMAGLQAKAYQNEQVKKRIAERKALEIAGIPVNQKHSRRRPQSKELELQTQCVSHFDRNYPSLKYLFFHVPNEGKMSDHTGSSLNDAGRRKGIPDIFLLLPSGQWNALALEFKKPNFKPSDIKPEQHKYREELLKFQIQHHFVSGFKQFLDIIESYVPPIYKVDFNLPFRIVNGELVQTKKK